MPVLKHLKQHLLLLDTHVWLWLMGGDSTINKKFVKTFEGLLEEGKILISPISFWEVGMLAEKGRIELDRDVLDWMNTSLEIPGIQIAPITPGIAIFSSRLPGSLHADPVDRLLIATAHGENAVLVTADEKILEYGQGKLISVYDPT